MLKDYVPFLLSLVKRLVTGFIVAVVFILIQSVSGFLGYKAILIGYAELVRPGDPATVVLTDITEGVRLRDRVMPNTHPEFDLYFEPHAPKKRIKALIIDIPGDYSKAQLD